MPKKLSVEESKILERQIKTFDPLYLMLIHGESLETVNCWGVNRSRKRKCWLCRPNTEPPPSHFKHHLLTMQSITYPLISLLQNIAQPLPSLTKSTTHPLLSDMHSNTQLILSQAKQIPSCLAGIFALKPCFCPF